MKVEKGYLRQRPIFGRRSAYGGSELLLIADPSVARVYERIRGRFDMICIPEKVRPFIPRFLKRLYRVFVNIRKKIGESIRYSSIRVSRNPAPGKVKVFYGHNYIPAFGDQIHGGMVKFQGLQRTFPNARYRYNIMYLGSSSLPSDWENLLKITREKKRKVVWNQNGVAYPAWHGPGWEKFNQPMKVLIHEADQVFYQSVFCKLSADTYLGKRAGPWEVLYNPVDTGFFTPAPRSTDSGELVLLLGGNQYEYYRLDAAIRTLGKLRKSSVRVKLLVTGKLSWSPSEKEAHEVARRLVSEEGVAHEVEFLGTYPQSIAPDIYRRAHILVHTKYNDPCPTVVLEAMACGLPVVYSNSGGVPELVGEDAGVGVPSELSWERINPPDPEALMRAVLTVAENIPLFSQAARQRAVDKFDLKSWIERHREVFEEIMSR